MCDHCRFVLHLSNFHFQDYAFKFMKNRIHFRQKIRFIMRISFLQAVFISVLFTVAYASDVTGQEILDTKISLDVQQGILREVLTKIEQIAEVKFLFHSQLVSAKEQVTIVARQERLADVLNKILAGRKISYEADGNQIILTKADAKKKR